MFLLAPVLGSCGGTASAGGAPPSSTTTAGDRWAVVLHRPSRVGERYHVERRIDEQVERNFRLRGRPDQHDGGSFSIRFEADAEVVAIDRNENELHSHFLVREFVEVVDGRRTVIARRGQSIDLARARSEEDAVATIDGRPIGDRERHAFQVMLGLREIPVVDPTWNDSPGPRAVGEHWHPSVDTIADDLNENSPFEVDDDDLTSDGVIRRHRTIDGQDRLDVAIGYEASRVVPKNLPRDARIVSSHLAARRVFDVPADPRLPWRGLASHFEADVRIERNVDGALGVVELHVRRDSESHYTPLH